MYPHPSVRVTAVRCTAMPWGTEFLYGHYYTPAMYKYIIRRRSDKSLCVAESPAPRYVPGRRYTTPHQNLPFFLAALLREQTKPLDQHQVHVSHPTSGRLEHRVSTLSYDTCNQMLLQ